MTKPKRKRAPGDDSDRLLDFGGRQSGRTQLMIDELIVAIVDGQPRSRVVAHSMDFALNHLMPRIAGAIRERGLNVTWPRREIIVVEGEQTIEFTTPEFLDGRRRSTRGVGEFWDHYADGIQ